MAAEQSPSQSCTLVLFGTQGDLSRRKLLPALYQLEKANLLTPHQKILGVARHHLSLEDYQSFVHEALMQFLKETIDEEIFKRFAAKLLFVQVDLKDVESYHILKTVLNPHDTIIVNYYATPPELYGIISEGLANAELISSTSRVIVEKPIGHDLNSSFAINDAIARYFSENQIYRIDHYLGKETVLNLLALRFANAIFSSHWDYQAIDHVQITVAEAVGVEGRWQYYDNAGQMRDMVQNHLLQVLSLIAMEPPVSLDADSIRDEKLKVLKALRPIDASNVHELVVRGQYTAGKINDQNVPGYIEETGAQALSQTETYVALKVHIDNWRWAGVPFYLRTGKRLAKKYTEVAIYFKPQPHNIFNAFHKQLSANKLIIRLQPDEGVEIQIMNKIPGLGKTIQLQESKLDLSFAQQFKSMRIAEAYERLLLEALQGNQYLFVRRDEVEQAWVWVDGIINAWAKLSESPKLYQAGSIGPSAALALLARDNRCWDD